MNEENIWKFIVILWEMQLLIRKTCTPFRLSNDQDDEIFTKTLEKEDFIRLIDKFRFIDTML